MKPTKFEGFTHEISKEQPQYLTLPAHVNKDTNVITSCWEMSFKERLRVLLTGRVYIQVSTGDLQIQPQRPSVINPVINTEESI